VVLSFHPPASFNADILHTPAVPNAFLKSTKKLTKPSCYMKTRPSFHYCTKVPVVFLFLRRKMADIKVENFGIILPLNPKKA